MLDRLDPRMAKHSQQSTTNCYTITQGWADAEWGGLPMRVVVGAATCSARDAGDISSPYY